MDREKNLGDWPSGEATAFEAVDGGSIPSSPARSARRSALRTMRGYYGVGLFNPKAEVNAGAALRACGVYGAAFMAVSGDRYRNSKADTMKAYRHLPVMNVADLHDAIPFDCIPVAVELVASARSLVTYTHPERAFYVFGPEDGTLGAKTLSWCRDVIYIPTDGCMNLAACVNVVLYDRMAKRVRL